MLSDLREKGISEKLTQYAVLSNFPRRPTCTHGNDMTKAVIGHAGDSTNLDYLRWIMDQGPSIGCARSSR